MRSLFKDCSGPKPSAPPPKLPEFALDRSGQITKLRCTPLLRTKMKPGPVANEDCVELGEQILEWAAQISEAVAAGKLSTDEPPLPPKLLKDPTKPLTQEEEQMLAQHYHTWGSIAARNRLAMSCIRLAQSAAYQYRRPDVRKDELANQAMVGLLRAAETFDPSRGYRFTTYASRWIRAKLQRLLQSHDKQTQPPMVGTEMQATAEGRRVRVRAQVKYFSEPVFDESDPAEFGDKLADRTADVEAQVSSSQIKTQVREIAAEIVAEMGDDRVAIVINDRLLTDEPKTFQEIGEKVGLSREGVRLIEAKILKRFRHKAERRGVR